MPGADPENKVVDYMSDAGDAASTTEEYIHNMSPEMIQAAAVQYDLHWIEEIVVRQSV